MKRSWWDLGEYSGKPGSQLAKSQIVCPFCLERGNFSLAHHEEKKKPSGNKILNFDTLECGNCRGYVLVFWSASSYGFKFHDFFVLPWPNKPEEFPEHWPPTVGRFWLQAHRSILEENWDAAAVMARSAMQAALRDQGAAGNNLKQEIDDLSGQGLLPPLMREWSHALRQLANESAHPDSDQPPVDPEDAKDILEFLDFLLEYLYNLPNEIAKYRARK